MIEIEKVIFICFSQGDYEIYQGTLDELELGELK
jgi:hypothetical protein